MIRTAIETNQCTRKNLEVFEEEYKEILRNIEDKIKEASSKGQFCCVIRNADENCPMPVQEYLEYLGYDLIFALIDGVEINWR